MKYLNRLSYVLILLVLVLLPIGNVFSQTSTNSLSITGVGANIPVVSDKYSIKFKDQEFKKYYNIKVEKDSYFPVNATIGFSDTSDPALSDILIEPINADFNSRKFGFDEKLEITSDGKYYILKKGKTYSFFIKLIGSIKTIKDQGNPGMYQYDSDTGSSLNNYFGFKLKHLTYLDSDYKKIVNQVKANDLDLYYQYVPRTKLVFYPDSLDTTKVHNMNLNPALGSYSVHPSQSFEIKAGTKGDTIKFNYYISDTKYNEKNTYNFFLIKYKNPDYHKTKEDVTHLVLTTKDREKFVNLKAVDGIQSFEWTVPANIPPGDYRLTTDIYRYQLPWFKILKSDTTNPVVTPPATIPFAESPKKEAPPIPKDIPVSTLADAQKNSVGEDVKVLQQILNYLGYTIAPAGPGSPGNETGSFGTLTEQALKEFQSDNGINPTGYFGPKTKEKMEDTLETVVVSSTPKSDKIEQKLTSDTANTETVDKSVSALNGKWNGKSKVIEKGDGSCPAGKLKLKVSEGEVTGSIDFAEYDLKLPIEGIVESNAIGIGMINPENNEFIAYWEAEISGKKASGVWADEESGCSGTWSLTKQ